MRPLAPPYPSAPPQHRLQWLQTPRTPFSLSVQGGLDASEGLHYSASPAPCHRPDRTETGHSGTVPGHSGTAHAYAPSAHIVHKTHGDAPCTEVPCCACAARALRERGSVSRIVHARKTRSHGIHWICDALGHARGPQGEAAPAAVSGVWHRHGRGRGCQGVGGPGRPSDAPSRGVSPGRAARRVSLSPFSCACWLVRRMLWTLHPATMQAMVCCPGPHPRATCMHVCACFQKKTGTKKSIEYRTDIPRALRSGRPANCTHSRSLV